MYTVDVVERTGDSLIVKLIEYEMICGGDVCHIETYKQFETEEQLNEVVDRLLANDKVCYVDTYDAAIRPNFYSHKDEYYVPGDTTRKRQLVEARKH